MPAPRNRHNNELTLQRPKKKPTAEKKQQQQQQQQVQLNPAHFKNNHGVVYFLRIYVTVVAGAVVGILGIEGIMGFVIYLISQLLCAVPVVLMAKGDIKKFFQGWSPVLTEHIFSQVTVLSYILFWMIFYNLCHVF